MTFDEFTRTHLPSLLHMATALCADRGTAEDVVQEVLLRAYTRWETIAASDTPEAYVRRMIVNEYLSWRRKWARVLPSAAPRESDDPSDHAAVVADRAELVAELARLPRRQRVVLVLRYIAGLSDAEIAAELGCSRGTVRSHASHALRSLRVHVEDNAREGVTDERLTH